MFEEIESEVLFGASGNSLAALKSGWSSPEPDFCWAIGLESLVVLPHPPAAIRYLLVLTVRPHLRRPTLNKQALIVAVNDLIVSTTEIFEDMSISCEIPLVAVALSDTLKIRLIHPNGASPRQVAGLPDDRELSVALERIALTCFGKLSDLLRATRQQCQQRQCPGGECGPGRGAGGHSGTHDVMFQAFCRFVPKALRIQSRLTL